MSVFKKKEDHELYTSFIQINSTNPRMNNLITIKDNVEVFPTEARVVSTFDVPIENVYDITLLSFYFSNQYFRITERNNKLKVTFFIPDDIGGTPSYGGAYNFTIVVDAGNYTAETLELELNSQYRELSPDVDYSVPLLASSGGGANDKPQYNLIMPTFSNPNFRPFQLVGHGEYKYIGHTVITLPIPENSQFFLHSNSIGDTHQEDSLDKVAKGLALVYGY